MPSHYAGFLRQPKWGHLRDLHKAIKHCEEYMISSDPTQVQLGVNLEVLNIFQDSSIIFQLNFDNPVSLIIQFLPFFSLALISYSILTYVILTASGACLL